jgi:hypothetical protein
MEDQEHVKTILAFCGWALSILGIGRYVGKLKGNVESNTESVEKLEGRFTDSNGEPRLMTNVAHDKIQNDCQAFQTERYNNLVKRLDERDKILFTHLDRLDVSVIELTKAISALSALYAERKQ